jgi:response regulator RpfG family c-di-GMP phosphodiesterase
MPISELNATVFGKVVPSMSTESAGRWRQRRLAATLLDVGVFLAPVAGASVSLWLLARPLSRLELVWRVVLLLAASTAAALVVERLTRRFLPLSALLRLTLVFPDRAPSRFTVARQAGNPAQLVARLSSRDVDEATAAESILALVGALAAHDRKTRGHAERVRAYTDLLTAELGLSDHDRDRLRWSALLHDIGKVRVDPKILNKAGKPTDREWAVLRAHPQQGEELAAALMPWLGEWGRAIVEHHERFDGAGYPHGVSRDDISVGGRILAVVDSFETMTAVRAYKKAMSHRAAREELARCAGSQFDPVIVRAFLEVSLPKVMWAMGPLSAALQLPWVTSLQYAGSRAIGLTGATATAMSAPVLAASVATVVAAPMAAAASSGPPAHVAVASSHHGASGARAAAAASQARGRATASPGPRLPSGHAPSPTTAGPAGPGTPSGRTTAAAVPAAAAPATARSSATGTTSPPSSGGATVNSAPTPSPAGSTTASPLKQAAPAKKTAPPPPAKKVAPPPPAKKVAPPPPAKKAGPPPKKAPPAKKTAPPPAKKVAPPAPAKKVTPPPPAKNAPPPAKKAAPPPPAKKVAPPPPVKNAPPPPAKNAPPPPPAKKAAAAAR